LDYTFNGVGDFILLQDNNSSSVVQVRAIQTKDANGILIFIFCTVKPVLRGRLWDKVMWPYKTGDLLKEVQFI